MREDENLEEVFKVLSGWLEIGNVLEFCFD